MVTPSRGPHLLLLTQSPVDRPGRPHLLVSVVSPPGALRLTQGSAFPAPALLSEAWPMPQPPADIARLWSGPVLCRAVWELSGAPLPTRPALRHGQEHVPWLLNRPLSPADTCRLLSWWLPRLGRGTPSAPRSVRNLAFVCPILACMSLLSTPLSPRLHVSCPPLSSAPPCLTCGVVPQAQPCVSCVAPASCVVRAVSTPFPGPQGQGLLSRPARGLAV